MIKTNTNQTAMKNYSTKLNGRKIEVTFDHPIFAHAIFDAQSTSFACQGSWIKTSVSILKSDFTEDALFSKIKSNMDILFYAW